METRASLAREAAMCTLVEMVMCIAGTRAAAGPSMKTVRGILPIGRRRLAIARRPLEIVLAMRPIEPGARGRRRLERAIPWVS